MSTVVPPPPITRWGHVWRYALVIIISTFAWWELAAWQWENARWWFWLDAVIGVAALIAVRWRRRYPVVMAVVLNGLGAVSGSIGGPATLALFSLATRRRWREVVPVGLIAIAGGLILIRDMTMDRGERTATVIAIVAVIGVTIGWGMYIGSRRELLTTLRDRATTAESEQASRVAQARTSERSRIAREMHDVLAHRISLVTMHAGALAYRTDLSPTEVRTTAELIQETSHQALVELREVLGVMREGPGDAAPEQPQPSARDIPALIEEARGAGLRVKTGDLRLLDDVPDSLGRTLYRIVQEGLTNVRKHAPDTLVTVAIVAKPDGGLDVLISNPLPVGAQRDATPLSGLGLVGLAERAALAGGRLTHGVRPGRVFVLEGWLPWPA